MVTGLTWGYSCQVPLVTSRDCGVELLDPVWEIIGDLGTEPEKDRVLNEVQWHRFHL